jgi:hypothetical protein
MMRALALAVSFLLFMGSALAQDVFTVPQVPVYAEAEGAAQAQERARVDGRRTAIDLLLRRLVAEDDWLYLPRLTEELPPEAVETGEVPTVEMPDPDAAYSGGPDPLESERPGMKQAIVLDRQALAELEEGFDVFNEKSSGTTYRANITYRFKPDAVRSLLQTARLPYSEAQAQEVLILPVLETEEGVYLWEAKNPWARAWLERPLTSELTPMALPRGDVMDIQQISSEEARDINAAALRAFAERYPQRKIFVALAKLTEKNGQFRLYVQLIDATPPAIGRGASASAIGTTITEAFFRGPNDDFPALARRAVQSTVARHARQWKRQTLVDYASERSFDLTAWYGSQQEFSDIRQAINSSPLVKSFKPGVFNRENAIMTLSVVGEEEQFRLAMAQSGLEVWQDTGSRWHIAEAERAEELKRSLEPLSTDIDEQAERRGGIGRFFGRGRSGSGEEIPELPDDLFGDGEGGR